MIVIAILAVIILAALYTAALFVVHAHELAVHGREQRQSQGKAKGHGAGGVEIAQLHTGGDNRA